MEFDAGTLKAVESELQLTFALRQTTYLLQNASPVRTSVDLRRRNE